jgi:hypothetical protein
MLRRGKTLYNITIPKTGRSCLVGMTTKESAKRLRTHVVSLTTPAQEAHMMFNDSETDITSMDFNDTAFYEMMKLNNFALLVCNDFVASDDEIVFDGDLVDAEYEPDDDHRLYFDRLLDFP